MEKNNRLGCVF